MKRKMLYLNLILTVGLLSSYPAFAEHTTNTNKPVSNTPSTTVTTEPKQTPSATASDAKITQQVKNSYAKDNLTKNTSVVLSTVNGVVYISGQVGSNSEVARLVEIAQSTTGVSDVNTSKLTVKSSEQPLTDVFITAKVKGILIKNQLFGDGAQVPAFNIGVETKNGIVILTGYVDNAPQKQKAEQLTKTIQGVKGLKSSLQIKNLQKSSPQTP